MKYRFILLSLIFLLVSPIGISKLGGAYWILYIPVCFASLLNGKNITDLKLVNNLGLFLFIVPSFLLFRFYEPITTYLGLSDAGFVWYFIVILIAQGGVVARNWDVATALASSEFSEHRNIARSIRSIYALIVVGPFFLVLPGTIDGGEYAGFDIGLYSNNNIPYLVLLGYAFIVLISVVLLIFHQPESLVISHNLNKELVDFQVSIKGLWLIIIVFSLSVASEFFYSRRNVPLILATWAPIWTYYFMFYYLSRLFKRFEGKTLTIKPDKRELGTVVFFISILFMAVVPPIITGIVKIVLNR